MKRILIPVFILAAVSHVLAQDTEFDITQYQPPEHYINVPEIKLESNNLFLMKAFYPLHYENEYEIRRDIRFVNRNDSTLQADWDSLGNIILGRTSLYSGIDWIDDRRTIHLMKYLPVVRLYDPPAIPLEGIKTIDYIEAAPHGLYQLLNLIQVIAGMNLLQLNSPFSSNYYLSDHPLLQESAYRFDIVALTLAMSVAQTIIPADSLAIILDSQSWKRHNPGWNVFENHFRYNWLLSSDSTLVSYLADEPYNSALVGLTTPPRPVKPKATDTDDDDTGIKLSAGGGRLGFSVSRTPLGLLEVTDIDSTGLAFLSGLQIGDQIRRVNGQVARNARDLMGKIIDDINTEGVYLIVVSEDEEIGLLLLPAEEEY